MTVLLALTAVNLCSSLDSMFFGSLYSIHYGYAIALLFTAIAGISYMFLSLDVFFAEKKPVYSPKLMLFRYGYAFFLLLIYIWGALNLLGSPEPITGVNELIQFIANELSHILLCIKAYSIARRVDDDAYKKPILYIGHFSLATQIMTIFYIIDSFDVGNAGATPWSFLATCVLSITAILVYVGFLKPVK